MLDEKDTDAQMCRYHGKPSKKRIDPYRTYTTGELLKLMKRGKKNGRGAYLKRSVEAVEIAKKRKALARSLECEIPEELYVALTEMFQTHE